MYGLHLTMKWKTQYLLFDWIMWFVLWLSSADVNECSLQTDNCSTNAYCTDTEGSYNCTCNFGYTGNGVTCCKRTTVALARILMKRSFSFIYRVHLLALCFILWICFMQCVVYKLCIIWAVIAPIFDLCSLYQWSSSTSQWFWAFSRPDGG